MGEVCFTSSPLSRALELSSSNSVSARYLFSLQSTFCGSCVATSYTMSDAKDEKEEAKKPSKNLLKPITDACGKGCEYVKKHHKEVISCAVAGVILLLGGKILKS